MIAGSRVFDRPVALAISVLPFEPTVIVPCALERLMNTPSASWFRDYAQPAPNSCRLCNASCCTRAVATQQWSVPESGRAIGSTGGVVDDVWGGPALDG
jgi:hypothetical protein